MNGRAPVIFLSSLTHPLQRTIIIINP